MNKIGFDNFEDMADWMVEKAEDGKLVSAIAFYDEAAKLMKEIILDDVDVAFAEIESPDIDKYDLEYIVSIFDNKLHVEKAYNDEHGKYLSTDADVLLLCCGTEYDEYIEDENYVASYHVESVCENCDFCDAELEDGIEDNSDDYLFKIVDRDGNIVWKINATLDIEIED